MRIALRKIKQIPMGSRRKDIPLHVLLGIQTHQHRQAILNDPRCDLYDSETRSHSHQHLFRETVTLAGNP